MINPIRIYIAIAISAVFGLLFAHDRYVAHDRDKAIANLATLQAKVNAETNKQIADNAIKHAEAQTKVDISDSNHALELATRNLDRQKTTKDLKALYENKANRTQSAIAGVGVVLLPADSNTSQADNIASDTERLAEVTRERDRAIADYKTLEDASIITTLDYNLLREWADTSCSIVECK